MKRSDYLALAATAILAVACLGAGTYLSLKILPLTETGLRAEGRVAAMERGARNSRWPVYEFATESGLEIRTRDLMQVAFAPIEIGDSVTVLYDPVDPTIATADLGPWLWRGPAIFFTGAVLLTGLGAVIALYGRNAKAAR